MDEGRPELVEDRVEHPRPLRIRERRVVNAPRLPLILSGPHFVASEAARLVDVASEWLSRPVIAAGVQNPDADAAADEVAGILVRRLRHARMLRRRQRVRDEEDRQVW